MTQAELHDQLDIEVKKLHEILKGISESHKQAVADIGESIEYITQLIEGYVPPKPEDNEPDLQ